MFRTPNLFFSICCILSLGFPIEYGNAEQHNQDSSIQVPYNYIFNDSNTDAYKKCIVNQSVNPKKYDVLHLNLLPYSISQDEIFNEQALSMLEKPSKSELSPEYSDPSAAKNMWQLYRAIDWAHMHHEQTYGIMSEHNIPWKLKKKWTDRAVRYYLGKQDIPRSPAPLEITMRRAGVIMKPYFTYFRNYYPKSNDFFYAAHWWHPAIYEAMMLGGNGSGQEKMVRETDDTMFTQVITDRPSRMLLSREIMPRYSRLSPESANIFDNLHMLHGIAYDIFAYKGWTIEEKRKELYRVIKAMSYQQGDEKYARKFSLSHPDVDPRIYQDWMKCTEGEINRLMTEMLEEMIPLMMPDGITTAMKEKLMEQFRMKLAPGMQEGEIPESLSDVMIKIMPEMKIIRNSTAPGETPAEIVELTMKGWQEKYAYMPDVEQMCMDREPVANPY